MGKGKLGIVITDGVGYRNFVLSTFLYEASKKFNSVIIYSGVPKESYINLPENIEVLELEIFNENIFYWFLRKIKEVAHLNLYKDKNLGIFDTFNFNKSKSKSIRGFLTRFIYVIVKLISSEKEILFFEKIQFFFLRKSQIYSKYKSILDKNSPNIIFFTHQRPGYLVPFLAAVNRKKINTSAFIFSWDNLASKGRMMGTFDNYFVWSDLMKQELLEFYPTTTANKVFIVGTPQFEPYVMDEYNVSKQSFYKKFGLDIGEKIICYSCADASIGANDTIHLKSVMNFINEFEEELQLLVRTSPAEDGQRFENLRKEFPGIKWNIPKWNQSRLNHSEAWSQRIPTKEDIADLKAILKYCDININMLSTMSLDFMLFDKPVINTVFGNESNGLYNDQRFLNYEHYKKVIKSKSVTIAKNEEDLFIQLNESLKYPSKRREERKTILSIEVGKPLKGTSKRIVEVLAKL